ncbi:MAG: sensor histidine kinase, partial [Proteobacteria bacterium]|nr:sensor histidine kinase [Pseudomonadota bacterium]
ILSSREEVLLKEVIKASIRNLGYLVKNRRPKLLLRCEYIKVYTNWHALFHIFTNLIANAIKYTPDERKPVVEVACNCCDNYVLVKIKDNGIGITDRELQNIFTPFN